MIKEKELNIGWRYSNGYNFFELIEPFDPNKECFRRISDGNLHFGREFIEFRNGERVIDLDVLY